MKRILHSDFLFSFLLLLNLSNSVKGQQDLQDSNIMTKNGTSIKDFPYFASLQACNGAIISDRWVVTPAHCVDNVKSNSGNRIWVGGESISKSQQINFDNIIIHPQYQYFGQIPFNDIALIQLTKPLKFTNKIKPVKLTAQIKNRNSKIIVVGKYSRADDIQSKTIETLELTRLKPWECLKYIPKEYHKSISPYLSTFDRINVCTKRSDDLGICVDEFGSLLIQRHQLIGLVSHSGVNYGNCEKNTLLFFTNVPTYVMWIKTVTGLK